MFTRISQPILIPNNGGSHPLIAMAKVNIGPITQLTHDRETSIRLFRNYQKRYPGKEPQWIVEKVIDDLVRDRGGKSPHHSNYTAQASPKCDRPKMSFTRPSNAAVRRDTWAWLVLLFIIALWMTLAQRQPLPSYVSPELQPPQGRQLTR